MKKASAVAALVLAGLGAAAFAGVGIPEQARGEAGGARTITVTGKGAVKAKPDEAAFSFGVDARAATARQASAENAAAMRRLLTALEHAGVRKGDLQTEQVSVWPDGKPNGGITGYTATSSVRVTSSVEDAGALVDTAMQAGATSVWGPTLTRTDNDELEERALRLALADARRKAGVLAGAADARLGEVVRMVEGGAVEPMHSERAASATAADATTPIEAGTVETVATLAVTFAMSE